MKGFKMPHLILEYSDNIPGIPEFKKLFSELHQVLVQVADIDIRNCKSRAIKLDNFSIADGQNTTSFVHLSLRIFSGRSDEIKIKMGENLRRVLADNFCPESSAKDVLITVEIDEIDNRFYFKYP
jgi:5-carboxymethyl-2-hydroxymuconate isomerase